MFYVKICVGKVYEAESAFKNKHSSIVSHHIVASVEDKEIKSLCNYLCL